MGDGNKLSLLGHLAELRSRLLKGVIAVVITCIISFVFADRIFQILVLPLNAVPLIYIDMTEMIGVYMKVCLAAGIFLAMPYLVYQMLMFVMPALTAKEKRYVFFVLPWIALMFIGGVVFSYYVLLPPATQFLTSFGSNIAAPQTRIGSYINVVTRVMLATGIVFEMPVISTFLARLGIITPGWLASKRKIAIVGAFVLGAIITPTFDPVNQTLVAAPLVVLFEVSILLAKLVQRRQPKTVMAAPNAAS
jgi:sec-independent protein translocase protein TatC